MRLSTTEGAMSDQPSALSSLSSAREAFRRRRWLGVGVFAVAAAVSMGVVSGVPAIYQATSTVLVDRQQVPDSYVRPVVVGEVETRLQTVNEQVLGRAHLEDIIARFHLYPELRRTASPEAVLQQMRKDTRFDVKTVEQAGGRSAAIAFSVSYRGWDPDLVAQVSNALATQYVEENSKGRERGAAETAAFLKNQVEVMKGKLEDEERRMGQRPSKMEAYIVALEGLNTRMRLNSDRQLRAMDRADRVGRSSAPGDSAAAPDALSARLSTLKQELAMLRMSYSDKYPEVIRVKSEIAALERRLQEGEREKRPAPPPRAAAATDGVGDPRSELKGLQDEERNLRGAISALERRIESAPQREQEFQQRARNYAMTKEVYDSLLKKYEDAHIAANMEQARRGEHFVLLDAAVPPKVPIGPHRTLLLVASLGLSMGLGVAAVLIAERLDTSFHGPGDLKSFTRVPIVADIPRLDTEAAINRRRRWSTVAVAVGLVAVVAMAGSSYRVAQGSEFLARTLSRAN